MGILVNQDNISATTACPMNEYSRFCLVAAHGTDWVAAEVDKYNRSLRELQYIIN